MQSHEDHMKVHDKHKNRLVPRSEEVRQEAGPDVIWRLAHGTIAWLMLHDCIPFVFELRTALFVRGYSGEKASGMISIRLV